MSIVRQRYGGAKWKLYPQYVIVLGMDAIPRLGIVQRIESLHKVLLGGICQGDAIQECVGYSGLPCGYCNRPLRLEQEVARYRLEVACTLLASLLCTSRFELVVAQEVVHRTRLVVQGVYPNLRYAAPLGNQQTPQLHDEVAEVKNKATHELPYFFIFSHWPLVDFFVLFEISCYICGVETVKQDLPMKH